MWLYFEDELRNEQNVMIALENFEKLKSMNLDFMWNRSGRGEKEEEEEGEGEEEGEAEAEGEDDWLAVAVWEEVRVGIPDRLLAHRQAQL